MICLMSPDEHPRVPESFLNGANRASITAFERALRLAGMRLLDDGRRRVLQDVSEAGDLVETVTLSSGGGDLTDEGIAALTVSDLLVGEGEARRILGEAVQRTAATAPMLEESATPWEELRRALILDVDPLPGLRLLHGWLADHADFFVIRATRMFYARALVWRLLTRAQEEGLTWIQAQGQGVSAVPRDAALPEIRASLFLAPMVARNQPLAAILETARYGTVVVVPRAGAFRRVSDLGGWPSGAGEGLRGTGEGVYATRYGQVPHELAPQLFSALVAGADALSRSLTSPAHWIREDREADVIERNIAWASVQFGLKDLVKIASTWDTSDRIWAGFRSLGTLEGLWQDSIRLRRLLDPSVIQRVAIAEMPGGYFRDIDEDFTARWCDELERLGSGSTERAGRNLVQVRNLVHGAGGYPQSRNIRMAALRQLGDANVQLVSDVARIWWTALITAPNRLGPPNRPD